MTSINEHELKKIQTLVESIKSAKPETQATEEYLQTVLMEEIKGLTQTEAEGILNNLEEGLASFNLQYNETVANGQINFNSMMASATMDMDDEQKFEFYVNLMASLRSVAMPKGELTEESITHIREKIIKGRSVTPETLDELKSEAEELLRTCEVLPINNDALKELASGVLGIERHDDIAEFPLYTAIAAYIMYHNGQLQNSSSYLIGTCIGYAVAAGIKQAELNLKLDNGCIDVPTWEFYTRIALKLVAFVTIVFLWTFCLSVFTMVPLAFFATEFGTIMSVYMMCIFLITTISNEAVVTSFFESVNNGINTFIEKLKTCCQVIGVIIKDFYEKMKAKVHTISYPETTQESVQEDTIDQPVETSAEDVKNTNIQDGLSVEPVMA